MSKKPTTHNTLIRIPIDLWEILDKASYHSKISINKLMINAIQSRKTFIEKNYIKKYVDAS